MLELILQQEEVRNNINKLVNHAEANVLTYEYMLEQSQKVKLGIPIDSIGSDPNHNIVLPLGFRVVFSIEEHPVGKCRHLSMSKNDNENITPEESLLIMEYFGFKSNLIDGNAMFYVEQYTIDNVHYKALNIIENYG
jgi:hypothetical protein